MKNRITQITAFLFMLTISFSIFGADKPVAISVVPGSKTVIVSNSNGMVSILGSKKMLIEKSMVLMKSIKNAAISKDGSTYWLMGNDLENGHAALMAFDIATWEKKSTIQCSDAAFAPDGTKVAYRTSTFAKELKIIDMISREKTGGIKFSFTDNDGSAEFVGYSGDSKYIFVAERKYGSEMREILKYNGDGYSTQSLQKLKSAKGVSSGFGTGIASKGEEHILIGWSETLKITADSCYVLDRGYDFCHTFYGLTGGDFFFILGSKGNRYKFEDLSTTTIEFEKVEGKFGNVSSAAMLDDKTCVYVTDQFVIGKFNNEGFTQGESMLEYKVDVVLTEYYKPENIKDLRSKLKKAGYKIEIPEKYSRSNRLVLEEGLSMKKAIAVIAELKKDKDIKSELQLSKQQ